MAHTVPENQTDTTGEITESDSLLKPKSMHILATHNTLSYARPTSWWMRLIRFTARCQNLTIEEQYDYGVRYFDIRARLKNDTLIAAHGVVSFNLSIADALNFLNQKNDAIVRIVFEDNVTESFIRTQADNHTSSYPNILFHQFIRKNDWWVLSTDKNNLNLSVDDYFKNFRGYKFIPIPRNYVKKYNSEKKKYTYGNLEQCTKNENNSFTIDMFDFVEL